jgi:hypothetical protein
MFNPRSEPTESGSADAEVADLAKNAEYLLLKKPLQRHLADRNNN